MLVDTRHHDSNEIQWNLQVNDVRRFSRWLPDRARHNKTAKCTCASVVVSDGLIRRIISVDIQRREEFSVFFFVSCAISLLLCLVISLFLSMTIGEYLVWCFPTEIFPRETMLFSVPSGDWHWCTWTNAWCLCKRYGSLWEKKRTKIHREISLGSVLMISSSKMCDIYRQKRE